MKNSYVERHDSGCAASVLSSSSSESDEDEKRKRIGTVPRRVSITNKPPDHEYNYESLDDDDSNDDEMARAMMMTNLMARNDGSVKDLSSALMERAVLVDSIQWLGNHLPGCVLNDLSTYIAKSLQAQNGNKKKKKKTKNRKSVNQSFDDDSGRIPKEKPITDCISDRTASETVKMNKKEKGADERMLSRRSSTNTAKQGNVQGRTLKSSSSRNPTVSGPMNMPFTVRYESALLFVDISGFTKLSSLLDVESLSRTINSYFQLIVDIVLTSGGDILKFAGDSLFAEWRVIQNEDISDESQSLNALTSSLSLHSDIAVCVNIAVTCGAKIVEKCSDYPVFSSSNKRDRGTQIATLNVHCGVGVGELAAVHVGNADRREFLIVGDAIDQVAVAERYANLGEFVASPKVLSILRDSCYLDDSLLDATEGDKLLLASRDCKFYRFKSIRPREKTGLQKHALKPSDILAFLCEGMDTSSLKNFQKLISLYVHPVVVMDEMAAIRHTSVLGSKSQQERHRAEAELRNVYTLFIKPLMSATLSSDALEDNRLFQRLNDIMNLVYSVLERFKGHLRQFIVDDKGVVLIATFGLRGSTCPRMLSERGLPAAMIIRGALKTELGLDCKIGGAYGKAYCGVVGGVKRHEYAVLGPSVNLSARLMMSEANPGILVDDEVRSKTDEAFQFRRLPAVYAKGYAQLVPNFEPLGMRKKTIDREFVGRESEIHQIYNVAMKMVSDNTQLAHFVVVTGESGSGKSAIVHQSTQLIRRELVAKKRSVLVTSSTSSEGDFLVPFSFFDPVFFGLLKDIVKRKPKDEESQATLKSIDRDDYSYGTESTASCNNLSSVYLGIFLQICEDIKAPGEFIDIVGHDVLGFPSLVSHDCYQKRSETVLNTIIHFMTEAFIFCTKSYELTLLVLDNAHCLDDMSWRVIQSIFENCASVIIICVSHPIPSFRSAMNENFLRSLHEELADIGRFHEMNIKALDEEEVSEMIARSVGCPRDHVDDNFCRNIFIQSGGMPLYARELLSGMRRLGGLKRLENGKIGLLTCPDGVDDVNYLSYTTFASLDDLIIHRLDKLDDSVRMTLQICAVLGKDFDISDLLAITDIVPGSDGANFMYTILGEIRTAVNEDILEEVQGQVPDQADRDLTNDRYHNDHDLDSGPNEGDSLSTRYRFTHNAWKNAILGMLLAERKRDMHKSIATALETREASQRRKDYRSRIMLFTHWKESGERLKAVAVAIDILKSFEQLGLPTQSITVIDDALCMWRVCTGEIEKLPTALDLISLEVADVENIIVLLIGKGKALANLHRIKESATAYQDCLTVLKECPASHQMKDRSVTFPIFSGLFVLLKFGIEQDEECTYEQELVRNFIDETKRHGDPVHYTRALAMQADMYGRLGKWELALESLQSIRLAYKVEEHSALISKYYGSDRCAQCIALGALWHCRIGSLDKAMQVCDDVVTNLMPQMEPRNVHNSIMIIFPIMWVMKDNGLALEVREIFNRYVVQEFHRHYGANAHTPCLYLYRPLLILLELAGNAENNSYLAPAEYIDFALDPKELYFSDAMNSSMANAGRDADSIGAEICLLLARRSDSTTTRANLVRKGYELAEGSMRCTKGNGGAVRFVSAHLQIKPIHESLTNMLLTMNE